MKTRSKNPFSVTPTYSLRFEANYSGSNKHISWHYERKIMGSASSTQTGQVEAIEYLSQLIQAHLVATRKHLKVQGLNPLQNIPTSPDAWEVGTHLFIDGFERDNDSVLASLLRALLQARETADEETNEAIEAVLRRSVEISLASQEDSKMGDDAELASFKKAGAVKTFVLSVLEDLLRRDQGDDEVEDMEEDDDQSDEMEEGVSHSDSLSSIGTEPSIKISMGGPVRDVRFDELLLYLWTNRMDTDCHVCAKPFENEPPIRTFRKIQEPEETTLHLRVFNRHFLCLKEGKHALVPVSHVWHDSIRDANKDVKPTRAATWTVLSTLEALFDGAEDAYLPEVEFWHDYVSVPQWEREIKEALLLWLPAIYHLADEILVHMADMPNPFISILFLRV